MEDHPDFEELSAYHDGEAPAWADHVAACQTCRDTVAALAALSAAVAESPPPSAAVGTDQAADPVRRAVAAAAAEGSGSNAESGDKQAPRTPPARTLSPPSRGRWLVAAVAAAAVVVVAAGLTAVLRRSPSPDSTTAAGRPPSTESATADNASGLAQEDDSAATALVGGDLGEIPDAATLVAKVGPELSSGRAAAGEGGAGVPAAPPVRSSLPGVSAVPEPRVVGTRPCEVEARAGRATLGDVVYVATASSGGRPAVVLAFAPVSGAGPVTVTMLTTADCRPVLEATTP